MLGTVEDAQSSGLSPAPNSSLVDVLSSAAALGVDVSHALPDLVGIFDPGHGLLVSSHVRAETVDLGSNEVLLYELHGISSSHSF